MMMTRTTALRASICCVLAVSVSAGGTLRSSSGVQAAASQAAPAASSKAGDAGSLEARAQAYWDRRQAKDLTGAYPFYCSSYRSRVSQAQFLQMTRLVRFTLQNVKVTRTVPKGDRMEVTVDYRFLVPTLPEPEAGGQTKEIWARDADGRWCKEDEPLVLPFPESTPTTPPAPPPGM